MTSYLEHGSFYGSVPRSGAQSEALTLETPAESRVTNMGTVNAEERSLLLLNRTPEPQLALELTKRGWHFAQATTYSEYASRLAWQPTHVLLEVRQDEYSIREAIGLALASAPDSAVVAWTAFSVTGDVRAILGYGARALLCKPASCEQVLWALGEAVSWAPCNLEVVRRRYIEEVLALAGSVSRAAQVLGLDRRSLRRMLDRFAEHSPPGSPIARWARQRDGYLRGLALSTGSQQEFGARSGDAGLTSGVRQAPLLERDKKKENFAKVARRRILFAHPDDATLRAWVEHARSYGFEVHCVHAVRAILPAVQVFQPDVLVSELRLADGPTLQELERVKELGQAIRVCVVTAYDSVASACACAKLGLDLYLAKPASQASWLKALSEPEPSQLCVESNYMRLDRVLWEYIHQTVLATGSIAKAAKVIEVDRRSLRRMLSKYAPPA